MKKKTNAVPKSALKTLRATAGPSAALKPEQINVGITRTAAAAAFALHIVSLVCGN